MIPPEAFEEGSGGRIKSLRIFHINPPLPEGWRTREEYVQDRQADERSEQRAIEAHAALLAQLRQNRIQMWVAFAACLIAAGALFLQTLQLRNELATPQSSTAVPISSRPALSPASVPARP